MNRLLFLPLLLLIGSILAIGTLSCDRTTKDKGTGAKDSSIVKIVAVKDTITPAQFPPLPIDYEKTKVLKSSYVVDRSGVELRQGPDHSAPVLGKYPYGTKLDVIAEEGDWVAVMDRIQRDYKGGQGEKGDVTRWEKIYVAKSKLGKQDQITISPKDLNLIVSITINGRETYYEKGHSLDKYLRLELIDEQTFSAARKTSKDYLIKDTMSYFKNGKVLELPLKNGEKLIFTDKGTDSELEERYSYKGHYDFLNAYAVEGDYWESSDVRLFDKLDGHLIVECGASPFFSSDKSYLMTLLADPYESTGDLQLFHVKQGKVSPMLFVRFKKWMPTWKEDLIFWGKDGCIYTAANHINGYWGDEGALNEKSQFIRISILPQ